MDCASDRTLTEHHHARMFTFKFRIRLVQHELVRYALWRWQVLSFVIKKWCSLVIFVCNNHIARSQVLNLMILF